MSDAPISEPEDDPGESLLIEAARAFEAGRREEAARSWRQAIPELRRAWPAPLADALCSGLELVLQMPIAAEQADAGGSAVRAWDAVEGWLSTADLPLAGGRSTPAHFRKHKRDPAVYRAVGLAEHLRLAGAGRAVALNNHALSLLALGRAEEALTLLHEAAALRREVFGWREAGLGTILGNIAAIEGAEAALPGDPVPVGADRYLALAQGQPELRRRLLAAAQLVPILRRRAG